MDPNETLRRIREAVARWTELEGKGPEWQAERTLIAAELIEHVEALDGWLTRGGFLPWAWTPPIAGGNEPSLPLCTGCGLPLETADDGTVFVYGTGTTADGLSYCPPDPDGEADDTHTFPAGYDDSAWQARQTALAAAELAETEATS